MPETMSLRQLLDSGAIIAPHEAIAIVQQLLQRQWDSAGDCCLRLDDLMLFADGNVQHPACVEPHESEIGRLLDTMLSAGTGQRVAGALRLTVARACRAVDAPPFGSLAALSGTLERFERGARQEVVRGLVSRAPTPAPETRTGMDLTRTVVPDATLAPVTSPPPVLLQPFRPERRHPTTSVSAVRRDLRDADAQLFKLHALLAATQAQERVRDETSPRTPSGIAVFIAAVLLSFVAGYAGMTLVGTWTRVHPARSATSPLNGRAPMLPSKADTARDDAVPPAPESGGSVATAPPPGGAGVSPRPGGPSDDAAPESADR